MSNILAIDTSHAFCSVALNCDGRIDSLSSTQPREHAQKLLPMIDTLLTRNHLAVKDLSAVAVVSGPGSFTGLRIGVGVAQGLAFGAQLPVLGVSSLAVMAYKASRVIHDALMLVGMKARDGELYCAVYHIQDNDAVLIGEERVGGIESIPISTLKDIKNVFAVGDAEDLIRQACAAGDMPPLQSLAGPCVSDAESLSILATQRFHRGEGGGASLALPVYLKEQMDYQE